LKIPNHFVIEKYDNLRIIRRKSISLAELVSVIKLNGIRKENLEVRLLKQGKRSSIYLFPALIEGKKINVCLKHYRFPGMNALKNIFIPSRALSSLKAAENLRSLGVKTAKSFAVIEERRGIFLKESFLIMEDISHFPSFPEYIERNFPSSLSKDNLNQKRTFIEEFARFLVNLHAKGIYQHDFKTTNILVEEVEPGKRDFWLIDLDKVIFGKKVSNRRRIKNLVQINTSIPGTTTLIDRVRFFHLYTGKNHLKKEDKEIIRKIIRLSWKRNPHWHPRFGIDSKKIVRWQ